MKKVFFIFTFPWLLFACGKDVFTVYHLAPPPPNVIGTPLSSYNDIISREIHFKINSCSIEKLFTMLKDVKKTKKLELNIEDIYVEKIIIDKNNKEIALTYNNKVLSVKEKKVYLLDDTELVGEVSYELTQYVNLYYIHNKSFTKDYSILNLWEYTVENINLKHDDILKKYTPVVNITDLSKTLGSKF